MHPQLKRFFIGVSWIILTFGGLVEGCFYMGPKFVDHWAFPVGILLVVAGGVFLQSAPAALFIIDWWRLKLGPTRLFPDSDEKARALRRPWAENQLTAQAIEASIHSERRDECKNTLDGFRLTPLEELVHDLKTMEKALVTREEELEKLGELQAKYRKWRKNASREHKLYLRMWDLFKGRKMLPIDPAKNAPYDDPDLFRKAAREEYLAKRHQETTVAASVLSEEPVSAIRTPVSA